VTVSIRRATHDDLDFLLALIEEPDVRPYLAAGARFDRDALAAELDTDDPKASGRYVIEVDGERAGTLAFHRTNERSRIAHLGGLAVHPRFRGRRVADQAARLFQRHLVNELGFHRLEMVVYGFNERAQAHAERAGWVREGVKRRAYRGERGWVDGVTYAVVEEDLVLRDHVDRFNESVRTGDFSSMLEPFADDAELRFEGLPFGPFSGKDAIAAAYRDLPPDDEIRIVDQRFEADTIVAGYAWLQEPERRAGELRLSHDGAAITRLVVTFD
jgi:RimJ/RimL family protein N-acetyltransferase